MAQQRHKTVQVNNLKIMYSVNRIRHWLVKAPDGRVLEEFRRKADAVRWAKKTKDFVRRR